MATASPPAHMLVPAKRGRDTFVPTLKGDLNAAVSSPAAFDEQALQAPRPVAWLVDRTLSRVPRIRPRDVALFEWLATLAIHADPLLTDVAVERLASVRQAGIALSGGGKPVLPRDIATSLQTLFGGEPHRLTLKDNFNFKLPSWVADLLRLGGHYTLLDHAALGRFKTKAGPLLYRFIVGQLGAEQVRFKPGAAAFELVVDPRDLAEQIGMPTFATFNPSLFKTAYLAPALAEVATHVREFEIVGTREEKRTRPRDWAGDATRDRIASLVLSVALKPPHDPRRLAVRKRTRDQLEALTAHPDEPRFQVSMSTLLRLASALPSEMLKGVGLLGSEVYRMRVLWWAALHEALSGEILTAGYMTRAYRGERLLAEVEAVGADVAFWRFAMEESTDPDLRPFLADKPRLAAQGDLARRIRHKRHRASETNAGRRALREARRDGTAPAPVAKVRKVEVEAVVEQNWTPVDAPAEVARQAADVPATGLSEPTATADEIARRLRNQDLQLEADRVYAATQLGQDFPDVQAARTLNDVIQRLEWGDFPRLAELDAVTGGGYMDVLKATQKYFARQHPFMVGDRLQHIHALATRSWIASVKNQRPDLRRSIETSVVALRRDTARYHAEWKAGSKARDAAMRARYNQPVPRTLDPDVIRSIEAKRAARD